MSCEIFTGRLDALYEVAALVESTRILEPTKAIAESEQSPQGKSEPAIEQRGEKSQMNESMTR